MKVWWCEEHQSSVEDQDDPSICLLAAWVDRNWQTPCRLVEMQLVPADARMEVWWCLNDESVGSSDRCDTAHKSYVPCRMVKAWLTIEAEPPKDPWDYDP